MVAEKGLVQSVTGKAFLENVPGKEGVYSFKHSHESLYLSVNRQNARVSFAIAESGWEESEFEFRVPAKQPSCMITTALDGSYFVALFSVSTQKWVRLNEQKQLVADANNITEATELILAPASVSPIFNSFSANDNITFATCNTLVVSHTKFVHADFFLINWLFSIQAYSLFIARRKLSLLNANLTKRF